MPGQLVSKATLARLAATSTRKVKEWMDKGWISYWILPKRVIRFDPQMVDEDLAPFYHPARTTGPSLRGDGGPEVGVAIPTCAIAPVCCAMLRRIRARIRKEELAGHFDVSTRTINHWMENEDIPFRQIPGCHPSFDVDEVKSAFSKYLVLADERKAASTRTLLVRTSNEGATGSPSPLPPHERRADTPSPERREVREDGSETPENKKIP